MARGAVFASVSGMQAMALVSVQAIYLTATHNYFGRYGKAPGEAPRTAVTAVSCVAGRGLAGDRFFDYKPDYRGQVTFFAAETHAAVCAHFGRPDLDAGVYGRNVITRGLDLNALVGQEFEIQGVRFAGTERCAPCAWMEQAVAPGAEAFLDGRGGLRARILSDGWLRVDG